MLKILLLLPFLCYAIDTTFKSQEASFHDNVIQLIGEVEINHPLGILRSARATLEKKENHIEQANFSDNVELLFSNNGYLKCENASIDFDQLTGNFSSLSHPVIFQDGMGNERSITLTCKQVNFTFLKEQEETYAIQTLKAIHDVYLHWINNIDVYADRADYQRLYDPLHIERIPVGTIDLYPMSGKQCLLKQDGSYMVCDKISINTKYKEIQMPLASGVIVDLDREKKVSFQTDLLHWNQNNHSLTFKKETTVEDPELGVIHTGEEMVVKRSDHLGKLAIDEIQSTGKATIDLRSGESLVCMGQSFLNKTRQTYCAYRPNKQESLDLSDQNLYISQNVHIYSDQIEMEYSLQEGHLHPLKILCKGHVRILAKDAKIPFNYVYANEIEYDLSQKLLTLSGTETSPVLLYHEQKEMELCAEKIVIENEEKIRGIGRIRFAFDREQKQLLKHFFKSPPPLIMIPLLEAKNLSKEYSHKKVVNDLSLTISPGEVVGLLGPNGAGKTTAFYMTIGLIKPDAGKIFFNGKEITSFPMHRRAQMGMGYLAQEPSVFRSLTVEENILCALEILPLTKEQRVSRLEQLLEELHLTELAKIKASKLSGGERRRLEITRALVTNPTLLLLDEPFANVDPLTVSDLKKMIRLLKEKNISILITDHNAREIFSIVDRSYLVYKGSLMAEGTVEALIENEEVKRSYLGHNFTL